MRRSRSSTFYNWEETYLDRAKCPVDLYEDLPSDDGDVNCTPTKTPARLEFERNPASVLRRPQDGLQPEMHLSLDYPSRPVDWRWQLVCTQVHRPYGDPLTESDRWIDRGRQYLQALLDCSDGAEQEQLARRMPDIHFAHTIYCSPNRFARGRLEGYLLTQQSFEAVATACLLAVETVEVYEQLFFNVRARLKHGLLIRKIAFDGKFQGGLTKEDVDLHLKMAGLQDAGANLKAMIRYYTSDLRIPDRFEGMTRQALVDLYEMLAIHTLIHCWASRPEEFTRVQLLAEFVTELRHVAKRWPDDGVLPRPSSFGRALMSAEQADMWWSSWRKAIELVAGKFPLANYGIIDGAAG